MKTLQENLDFLLDKYSVDKTVTLQDENTAVVDGKTVPVLSWRSERRFKEMKNIVDNKTVTGISVMRVTHIAEKSADLQKALYRELDICKFILSDTYKTVMALQNGHTLNVIAGTNKGYVCTLELAATLMPGQTPIDKHEIISERGICCDTVVDAQLKQDSVYVFTDGKKAYTDVDFELYGLSADKVATVRFAFEVARDNKEEDTVSMHTYLLDVLKAVEQSLKTGERVAL